MTDTRRKSRVCSFCHCGDSDPCVYGELHFDKGSNLSCHSFCLYFSSALTQVDGDENFFDGFDLSDIKKELIRSNRLKCCLCKKSNASVGCTVRKCTVKYHYTCGQKSGALFQHFGSFKSFCKRHRPVQEHRVDLTRKPPPWCVICLSEIEVEDRALVAPCCADTTIFHEHCIQKYAVISGKHAFKCPICNNVDTFQAEMLVQGIHIPDKDAEWELEPNAFEELRQPPARCGMRRCRCPRGAEYDDDDGVSPWDIVLCNTCGCGGRHRGCLYFGRDKWTCPECNDIQVKCRKRLRRENKLTKKGAVKKKPRSDEELKRDMKIRECYVKLERLVLPSVCLKLERLVLPGFSVNTAEDVKAKRKRLRYKGYSGLNYRKKYRKKYHKINCNFARGRKKKMVDSNPCMTSVGTMTEMLADGDYAFSEENDCMYNVEVACGGEENSFGEEVVVISDDEDNQCDLLDVAGNGGMLDRAVCYDEVDININDIMIVDVSVEHSADVDEMFDDTRATLEPDPGYDHVGDTAGVSDEPTVEVGSTNGNDIVCSTVADKCVNSSAFCTNGSTVGGGTAVMVDEEKGNVIGERKGDCLGGYCVDAKNTRGRVGAYAAVMGTVLRHTSDAGRVFGSSNQAGAKSSRQAVARHDVRRLRGTRYAGHVKMDVLDSCGDVCELVVKDRENMFMFKNRKVTERSLVKFIRVK